MPIKINILMERSIDQIPEITMITPHRLDSEGFTGALVEFGKMKEQGRIIRMSPRKIKNWSLKESMDPMTISKKPIQSLKDQAMPISITSCYTKCIYYPYTLNPWDYNDLYNSRKEKF